jgi:hypothetical protein
MFFLSVLCVSVVNPKKEGAEPKLRPFGGRRITQWMQDEQKQRLELLWPSGLCFSRGKPDFLESIFEPNHSHRPLISHNGNLLQVLSDHQLDGSDNPFPDLHRGIKGQPVFVRQKDFINLCSPHDPKNPKEMASQKVAKASFPSFRPA